MTHACIHHICFHASCQTEELFQKILFILVSIFCSYISMEEVLVVLVESVHNISVRFHHISLTRAPGQSSYSHLYRHEGKIL